MMKSAFAKAEKQVSLSVQLQFKTSEHSVLYYSVIGAVVSSDGLNLSCNLASHAPLAGCASPCQISLAVHSHTNYHSGTNP